MERNYMLDLVKDLVGASAPNTVYKISNKIYGEDYSYNMYVFVVAGNIVKMSCIQDGYGDIPVGCCYSNDVTEFNIQDLSKLADNDKSYLDKRQEEILKEKIAELA